MTLVICVEYSWINQYLFLCFYHKHFLVLVDVDFILICPFIGSFLSCFLAEVLPSKFCEGTEPGSNFYLNNEFLISVSTKWWWHKTVSEETLKISLLLCLFIRLHQRLISDGNEGNFKKCVPVAASSLSLNILEYPKAVHSFRFLHVFLWFNTVETNFPRNIFLSQLKITVINVATQLKPRFCVMLVLLNLFRKLLLNRNQNIYFRNTRVYNLSYGPHITYFFSSWS